jgi:hypothetical protein
MSPRYDEEFKKLEKLWYDKLKSEGFEDIEHASSRNLKEWDLNFFRNQFCTIKYETSMEYYEKAKDLLLTFEFKNELHKKIWELHCMGLTEREIADKIQIYKKVWFMW